MAITTYFDDTSDLMKLDWATIKASQWADTNADGDRKRRKQAEFLVHDFLPWECIEQIGVRTPEKLDEVKEILGAEVTAVVRRPRWYY